jgi:NADPH:quinone reductase-like Zn-dependent oxidoreductase
MYMKAVELQGFGIDNLQVVERVKPQPAAGQVLVQIKAVSLNYLDLALVQGSYNPSLAMPFTPGADGAGEIVATGAGVKQWQPGDQVIVHFTQNWLSGAITPDVVTAKVGSSIPGIFAEFVLLPAHGLVRAPVHMNSIEAATLPIAGLTAWAGLLVHGKLQVGQTVLTQGTGGVSIAALQLAKAAGARVIATSGSDDKLQKLKELGADEVINYKTTPDWDDRVLALTAGHGADVTIDVAGAASIAKSINAVKMNGTVGVIGFISGTSAHLSLINAIKKNVNVKGYQGGSRQDFENYVAALELHRIKPVIDQVFRIEQVQEAYRYLESGKHFGKIVVGL